jgi:hypothetical protein
MKKYMYKIPYIFSLILITISFLFMLIFKLICMKYEFPNIFYWQISTSFLFFYAVGSSLICLKADDINKYFINAIIAFGILALVASTLARQFSGIALEDAQSYSWIIKVVSFGFLVFLSIIGLIKRVEIFARNEDEKIDSEK